MRNTKSNNTSARKKGSAAASFPYKLMEILTTPAYNDIVTFLPCGKAFKILKPKDFTNRILPVHFKEAKYSSFKRKLHRWGFERIRDAVTPQDSNVPRSDWFGSEETFYHEHFVRDQVDLIEKMGGITTNNNKNGTSSKATITALKATNKPTAGVKASIIATTTAAAVTKATTASSVATTIPPPPIRRSASEAFRSTTTILSPSSLPPRKRLRAVESSMTSASTTTSATPPPVNAQAAQRAVIEAEVARRLRQQIAVAQLSKQRALLMMEQQRVQQRQQQVAAAAASAAAAYDQREILKNVLAKYTAAKQQQQQAASFSIGISKQGSSAGDIGAPLVRLPSEKNVMPRTA